MPSTSTFRTRLLSVLFWSIIAAAFIGPGTVTTASKAGASLGMGLLWALLFSIVATIVLQEAAARITIASGKNLGEILAIKYGAEGRSRIKVLLFLAVAFGCAAYQAGNMLGALGGIALFANWPQSVMTVLLAVICAAFLWSGNYKRIANLLGLVVALMGMAFIFAAFRSELPAGAWDKAFVPEVTNANALLIIGLIGTTIVPYNLFLGSGISKGQTMTDMRWGLALAVIIGGLISIAIMVVGTQVEGAFSFPAIAAAMTDKMGAQGSVIFGIGLFAAGMSSSITSPLAAAVTAQSLFDWSPTSRNFRLVWLSVLGVGLLFGLLEVKPIPAIIMAQAINGALLPIIAIFLLLTANDQQLLGTPFANGIGLNIITLLIVGITCFLGLHNVWKALEKIFAGMSDLGNLGFWLNGGLSIFILLGVAARIFSRKE